MTGFLVGMDPTRVYTPTEILQGKAPGKGSVGSTHDGKVLRMVEIAAGPVVRGDVVALQANNYAVRTTAASSGATPNVGPLAVAINTVTASASAHIFVQLYGPADVKCESTGSISPGAAFRLGADGAIATVVATASTWIAGITCNTTVTVTFSVAGALLACFLNYPKVAAA